MVSQVNGFDAPRYDTLRLVPFRYRRMLPLQVMKRYRCVVVGATRERLTVAFAKPPNRSVLILLQKLSGRAIFPVLVRPARLRLLLGRITQRRAASRWPYFIHGYLIHALNEAIVSQPHDEP